MAYTLADFAIGASGPQFAWLDERLTIHGFPCEGYDDTIQKRLQRWQLAQGWEGTELGGDADGYMGRVSLARLTADPVIPAGIDLTRWKVTLPVGDPDEIYPIGYHESAPWFVNHGTAGITFRAPVDGATTSNSGYPRSELREMNADGSRADWSNRGEAHRMLGTCHVTELPGGKRELVFAQIHDADDDVVMLLVSDDKVYASWSRGKGQGSERVLLFSGYRLGDRLSYVILADEWGVSVSVNGYRSSKGRLIDGAYFKAGCYSQANESNGTGHAEVLYTQLSLAAAG